MYVNTKLSHRKLFFEFERSIRQFVVLQVNFNSRLELNRLSDYLSSYER